MQYFLTPDEVINWLGTYLDDGGNWVIAWNIRPSVCRVLESGDSKAIQYYKEHGNGVQFFLGTKLLRDAPVMREGKRGIELDFRNSLCLQLVPCVYLEGVLLKGYLSTLKFNQYHGVSGKDKFWEWRSSILKKFKKDMTDKSLIITQELENGTRKYWEETIVSNEAAKLCQNRILLKEFPKGAVTFSCEYRSR